MPKKFLLDLLENKEREKKKLVSWSINHNSFATQIGKTQTIGTLI